MKKKIGYIASFLFTTLLVGGLGLALFLLVTARFPLFNIHSFVVMSGSMEPRLPVGSIVLSRPSSSYDLDDVLTFKRGNIVVTHRVVSTRGSGSAKRFIVKGDANNVADSEMVAMNQIIGKQIFVIPGLGQFIHVLRQPWGFFLFVIIPTLVYISFEGYQIKCEFERSIEQRVRAQLGVA